MGETATPANFFVLVSSKVTDKHSSNTAHDFKSDCVQWLDFDTNQFEVALLQLEFTPEACEDKNFVLCINTVNEFNNLIDGNTVPVLKWISFKKTDRKTLSFTQPQYKAVKAGRYNTLHLHTETLTGKSFTHLTDRTTCLLHFRRKRWD